MQPFNINAPLLDGATVLEASAGTGKTWNIAELVLRLVAERGMPIERILVVTFTRAATAELRSRVRARLADARAAETDPTRLQRLETALTDYDEAAIATIHGFCQRVLLENAFESGAEFDLTLVGDAGEHLRQLAADYWLSLSHDLTPGELAALTAAKMNVSDLVKCGWAWLRTPDAQLHPAPAPASSGVAAWAAACQEACDAWRTHRSAALSAIDEAAPGMHKWFVDNRERLVDDLDRWVDKGGDPRGNVQALHYLTQSVLESKTKKAGTPPKHPVFMLLERTREAAEIFADTHDRWAVQIKRGFVDHLAARLPEAKRRLAEQTYDDLLQDLRDGLRDARRGPLLREVIRKRLDAALIDEFQDTDPVQWEIFHELFLNDPPCPLYLIGDPKQAIYQFRGADIYAYLAARNAAQREFTLDRAWRADEPLVHAVNHLFGRLDNPFHTDHIRYPEVKPVQPVRLRWPDGRARDPLVIRLTHEEYAKKGAVAYQVAGEIADVLRDPPELQTSDGVWRPVTPSDLAVLVRQHKEAAAVVEALADLGVPAVRQGAGDVFAEAEADHLQTLLRAIANPSDRRALRTVLMSPFVELGAAEVLDLDDSAWEQWVKRLRAWRVRWIDQGFVQAVRRALEELGATERLAGSVDGRRRVTNLVHLVERLHEQSADHPREPERLVAWLNARMAEAKAEAHPPETDRLRLETDEPAVQVVTIHAAKGLEWPLTWCPYLTSGGKPDERHTAFHDPDPPFGTHLDISFDKKKPGISQARAEQRSEDRRLCYVALTRARHRCVVTWGPFWGHQWSALGEFFDKSTSEDAVRQAVAGAPISVEPCGEPRYEPLAPATTDPTALSAAEYQRVAPLDTWWRRASFSSLKGGAHAAPTVREEDGIDRDADTNVETATVERPDEPRLPLAHVPGGTKLGDYLHEVLEHADFAWDVPTLQRSLEARAARHGIDEAHAPALAQALHTLLRVPLDAAVGPLCDVPAADRLDELGFDMVLREGTTSAKALGAVIDAHHDPNGPLPAGYGARVAALGFLPLRGYLNGYIDLVFRKDGRTFVVDWKSNRLGDHASDFTPERLAQAMVDSHYALQALLYSVAVHRFLGSRLPGYDYDHHFGGVFYLYLRGMTGGNQGIFRWQPPRALIEAVSDLLSPEVSR